MANSQEKRTFRLKVWQMILVPIILALIPLIYPEIKALFMRKLPQFVIENPIISKGDSVLHIFAENGPARKREELNIEVEGLEFRDAGKLVSENPLEWEFDFTKYDIPDVLFTEGINVIRIGFPSSVGYDELKVYVRPNFYQAVAVNDGDVTPKLNFLDSTQNYQETGVKKIFITSNTMSQDGRVFVTQNALRGAGYNASGLESQTHFKKVEANELHYFHKEDEKRAYEVAEMIEKDLKMPLKVKKVAKELPQAKEQLKGQLEIVFAKE
ncbi:MAG: hypothetical protein AAGG68_04340 [Bacteroidota bacterium]